MYFAEDADVMSAASEACVAHVTGTRHDDVTREVAVPTFPSADTRHWHAPR